MKRIDLIAPDGTKKGDSIPNSRYFRAFCERCGEPMRVTSTNGIHFCEDCDPPHSRNAVGNANASLNSVDKDPDAFGSFN